MVEKTDRQRARVGSGLVQREEGWCKCTKDGRKWERVQFRVCVLVA